MVAADLVGHPEKGVTATILERAVEGELRVVETGRKKYAVEFVGAGRARRPRTRGPSSRRCTAATRFPARAGEPEVERTSASAACRCRSGSP